MLTPKVTETVRLSPHRRPAPVPTRPVPPAASAGGGRRHGGRPAAH
jgi:hypothetical protein